MSLQNQDIDPNQYVMLRAMCTKIAAAFVKGTSPAKLPGKVLEKFAFSYHLLLSGFLGLSEED